VIVLVVIDTDVIASRVDGGRFVVFGQGWHGC
jgi:hypothetical protein